MTTTTHVLRIDTSARKGGSVSRQLTDEIITRLTPAKVTTRDLADGIALIDEAWVEANFTPAAERSADHKATLAGSDTLVAELRAADTLVIGLPVYNFSVPTALKAWVDQVARAGLTFRYTADGPKGLLTGKRAIIAIASGGTQLDSDIDFAGRYLRHVLGFIGITQVEFIRADAMMTDAGALERAQAQVAALAA